MLIYEDIDNNLNNNNLNNNTNTNTNNDRTNSILSSCIILGIFSIIVLCISFCKCTGHSRCEFDKKLINDTCCNNCCKE